MSCLERLLDVKLAELKSDMATKDCINDLKNIIVEQKSRIEELESRVIVMEKLIQNLNGRSDDSEQYQRRLCLRIGGVELKQGANGESGDECLKIVKKIFRELKCDGKFQYFGNTNELLDFIQSMEETLEETAEKSEKSDESEEE
eukprot:Seg1342.8 transcript_id=Seg1342.8/GoldUCD/mRNA.D3Y31 product="hypothetical protein" protein_id=Seg1342.8/GoldUCD/D3Y31